MKFLEGSACKGEHQLKNLLGLVYRCYINLEYAIGNKTVAEKELLFTKQYHYYSAVL